MKAVRLEENPLITPGTDPSIGENINGPSLVRLPDWMDPDWKDPHWKVPDRVERPLGRYYLYFASHQGTCIRLAFADSIQGPYRVHPPGTLRLDRTRFGGHIASPDVHVDHGRREIRMYYHGCCRPRGAGGPAQLTCAATSRDGLRFEDRGEILGSSYWRLFERDGWHYALEMPGRLRRSRDPYTGFQEGPLLFPETMRHSAVMPRGDVLHVFWSNKGDCPERILHSRIDLSEDWTEWQATEPVTLLEPETEYEGARLALEPSRGGSAPGPVRQLRDPCVYEEAGKAWLLYSVAGEHGIAIARLVE